MKFKAIRDYDEFIMTVEEAGFMPLFKSSVPGLSLEEKTDPVFWFSGDPERDPWEWRIPASERNDMIYGKFFDGKAGFVSKSWFPALANYRRDGYDFEGLWDEGLVSRKEKQIMDLFPIGAEMFAFEAKRKAGFGRDGEKGFDAAINRLMMKTFLAAADFRQKLNKRGEPYGWHVTVLTTPESRFGEAFMESAYTEEPEKSRERLWAQIRKLCPSADEAAVAALMTR